MVIIVESRGGSETVRVDAIDGWVRIIVVRDMALLEVAMMRGRGVGGAVARSDGRRFSNFVAGGWIDDASHRKVLLRLRRQQKSKKSGRGGRYEDQIIVNCASAALNELNTTALTPETDGVASAGRFHLSGK